MTQKTTQRCYLILKSFQSRDRATLTRAFTAYVRPLLESNSQVWSPHLLGDIRRVENVQRRFTKRLDGLYSLPYTERLRLPGLELLEARRLRADLIFAYKLLFGHTPLNVQDFFLPLSTAATRGSSV